MARSKGLRFARLRALGRSRSQQSTGLLLCPARPSNPFVLKRNPPPHRGEKFLGPLEGIAIRAPAGTWSLAVATVHWTVALSRSSFESLRFKKKSPASPRREISWPARRDCDSRACGHLVARGRNSPLDCCSVPLVLRIPSF